VDDERPLADLLGTILNLSGFEVKTAYNGVDAIAIARGFVPDFVISDFSMPPGINGMEAAEQIKRMLPGCRILLLSGQHLEGEFIRYESRGYKFRLLTKPVHPQELLRIIREDDVAEMIENPPCVLNVDDVEAHRYSISRLFSRAGFKVIEAASGGDAIRKAKEEKPDLILMDVNLPDMNGFTACSQIRSDPENSFTTIVHITASSKGEEGARLSAQAGADGFLPYPITPAQLVHRVRELLQLRYLQKKSA